ncbi:uncharacterized protein LOC131876147 [Cryptomeria japonica]|uniref:uncharacterized protein LOC131876147 n=1 Tax=Cryptomeria japonica TaxID=3369 RepID=UPI0027DA4919|nr:uncharacterized protein LOC131876147 [Cryptomeria japonica]
MIKEKSISAEVFMKGSNFMKWWQQYRDLRSQSHQWQSSSSLFSFVADVRQRPYHRVPRTCLSAAASLRAFRRRLPSSAAAVLAPSGTTSISSAAVRASPKVSAAPPELPPSAPPPDRSRHLHLRAALRVTIYAASSAAAAGTSPAASLRTPAASAHPGSGFLPPGNYSSAAGLRHVTDAAPTLGLREPPRRPPPGSHVSTVSRKPYDASIVRTAMPAAQSPLPHHHPYSTEYPVSCPRNPSVRRA